ncbi:hypothetical protein BCO9919_06786 [Burkholderia cenocepacia]|uniref:Uncharacterized protein n=1 Tax=Burkholderia cenocepacia TaxID=95486 RepID=A0A6J5JW02_9BURK|nr:hypothetical protein BCO9919_06786 [Burkholderia cenocepacia]
MQPLTIEEMTHAAKQRKIFMGALWRTALDSKSMIRMPP